MAKFETFLESHERIFGRKTFRQLASSPDGINRHQHRLIGGSGVVHITNISKKKAVKKKVRAKKELCPHCATMNLIRVDTWTVKCNKCGFER